MYFKKNTTYDCTQFYPSSHVKPVAFLLKSASQLSSNIKSFPGTFKCPIWVSLKRETNSDPLEKNTYSFFPFSKVASNTQRERDRGREKRRKKKFSAAVVALRSKRVAFQTNIYPLLILRLSLVKKRKMQQSPRSKKTLFP